MDASKEPKPDLLSAYRAKRSPDRTPEPFGGFDAGPGKLFVVHKHAARRLHYDLRVEMEGVLRSWAVLPRAASSKSTGSDCFKRTSNPAFLPGCTERT